MAKEKFTIYKGGLIVFRNASSEMVRKYLKENTTYTVAQCKKAIQYAFARGDTDEANGIRVHHCKKVEKKVEKKEVTE